MSAAHVDVAGAESNKSWNFQRLVIFSSLTTADVNPPPFTWSDCLIIRTAPLILVISYFVEWPDIPSVPSKVIISPTLNLAPLSTVISLLVTA